MTKPYRQVVVGPGAVSYGLAWRCPDCPSEARPVAVAPDVVAVEVGHDPSCPWLRARGVLGTVS